MGVVGKVGSGKSSLLAAITAEMRKKDGQVSLYSLRGCPSRSGHVPVLLAVFPPVYLQQGGPPCLS